jgi:hypothetical protein
MRVLERVRHGDGDVHRVHHRKLTLPVEPVPETLSLHVRHDVEEKRVGLARIEEGEEVGVAKPRRHPDLGQEAFRPDDRGQLRLQDLQRHVALMLQVPGQVDGGHAALSEFTLDAIAARKGGLQASGVGVGHGATAPVCICRTTAGQLRIQT